MKKCYRLFSLVVLWLTISLSTSWAQDGVTYGFIQDPNDPLMVTAVAIPNYNSTNVTISTAVFSFLLPEGTTTDPSVPPVPATGAFNNITGTWDAQLVTPTVYDNAGFDPADLMGNDVYQVVLQNSPVFNAGNPVVAGTPIELFSFTLPSDCMGGNVEVLTNDGPIQMAILTNLGANFNNQMSMSIDDAPTMDIYLGNDQASFSLPCPLDDMPVAVDDMATTDENTPVNIDVLVNDDFGNNGPSTGAITITAAAMNGTAVVNDGGTPNDPTDDTIDYTPDTGFDGTDMLTYEICDANGDCDDAVATVTVLDAQIGLAKAASTPVGNGDGTFTTTITMTVENFGQVALGDIQVSDNLSAFGTPVSLANVDMEDEYNVSNLMFTSNSADPLSVNTAFNGANADTLLLDVAAGGTLAVGEEVALTFDLTFYPSQDTYTNEAVAIGDVPFNDDPTGSPDDDPEDTSDDSTDGQNPDPNDDDDPEEDDPTPIDPDDMPIAVDDAVSTDENTPVNITVLANDDFGTDGPSTGVITITAFAMNGTAVVNNGGTPNDPTDDTIDYTPNAGFAGTDMVTYQICDSDGDCDAAVVTITVLDAQIGIAKAASTPVSNGDGTFTTTITLTVENFGQIELGDVQVTDDLSVFGSFVTLANLDMEGEYTISGLTFVSNSANSLSVNSGFNGAGDTELLNVAAGGTLGVGEVVTLQFDLRFNPAQDSYTNMAIASGDVPENDDPTGDPDDDPDDTTDDSTDGPDPDPNDDDDPEEDTPTPIDPDDMPIANDDMASTDPGLLVNVDVLANDDFGSDGPSTGAITIVSGPANGTAIVDDNSTPNDPTDDSIDYTPGLGVTMDMLTYQICDSDGDCDDAVVTIMVSDIQIGIAKAASTPVNNNDGTFTTTTTLTVENFGNVPLGDIQVTDDLSAFGAFVTPANLDMEGEYTVSNLMFISNSADPMGVNNGFNGAGDVELLNVAAGGTLGVGEVVTLSFDLTFNPAQDSYLNTAVATGDLPANDDPTGNPDDDPADTTDDSTDGTDPDPNDDDDPEEDDPTPIDPDDMPDAVNDMVSTDQNTPINIDPLVNDDFGSDGPSTGTITLISGPINGTGTVNDGGTPTDPTDDTVDYTPDSGYSGSDIITYQICDSDGDCDVASINITVRDAQIGVAKAASTPIVNMDGSFTTTITMTIENFGEVDLGDVQLTDDLSAFGSFVSLANLDMEGEYTVSGLTFVSNSADPLGLNTSFNGAGETALLDVTAGGTLAVGEVVTLSFDLRFISAQDTYLNTAVASGDVPLNDDPTGSPDDDPEDTTDDSTDGTDPDPNGNDDPDEDTPTPIDPNDVPVAVDDVAATDESTPINIDPLVNDDFGSDGPGTGAISIISGPINGTGTVNEGGTPNDPTDDTIDYTPDPGYDGNDIITYQICDSDGDCDVASINITVRDALIGIAKEAGTPVSNPDGSFTTTITMTIENFGQVELGDVQVTDDLSAFGSFVSLANLDMEGEYTVSGLTVVSNSANAMSVNTGFNGAGDTELLNVAAGGTLGVGEVVTLSFDLRFIAAQDSYINVAVASGDVPANDDPTGSPDDDPDDTTDDSTDGTDPDPNDDDDPDEDDPTPVDPDDVPDAVADMATTNQNTTVNIDPLVNDDFGSDGPSTTGPISIVSAPINGLAVVDNNGTPNDPTDDTIDYIPGSGFTGTDVLTYEICDSDGDCDAAPVNITVLEAQIGIAKDASEPVAIGGGLFTTTITLTVENFSQVVLGDIQVTDDLSAFGSFVSLANLDMEGEYTVSNITITSNTADILKANPNFNGASDMELFDVDAGGVLGIGEVVVLTFDLTFDPAQDSYTNVAVATGDVPANDDPTGSDDDDPADTTDDSTDGTNPDPNDDDIPDEDDPTPIDPDDVPDAVNDAVATPQNTPLNIDPLVNDDFGSDGPGSGTISILSGPINGTGIVNNGGTPNDQSDDTIDYTPDPGYAGNDIVTYQICDSDGDCDIASINILVLNAEIGIAKLASPPADNGNGSFTTTITLNVENFGNVALGDIQVTDDLTAFGTYVTPANLDMTGEYTVSSLTITSNSANALSVNPSFNGAFDTELLDVSAGGTLAIGENVTISFNLTFFPAQDTYLNVAVASGDVPVNDDPTGNDDNDPDDTTDNSTDGTDPDPNNDGDPEEDVPTPIDPNDVPVAMNDVASTNENTPINIDPLVNDDFGSDGPSIGAITIISGPIDGTGVVNNGGTPNDPTDDTFDYTPDPGFSGNDIITYQICDSDGDCDIASVNITVRDAQIGIAKASSTPVSNGDGTYTTTITMTVENFGQVDLGDIQVTDDLSAFGSFVTLANLDMDGEYTVSNLTITANSADPLSVNTGFNGAGDTELLNVAAGGTLVAGESVTLSFDLRLDPVQDTYTNVAVASGDVPFNDDPTGNDDNDPDDTTDNSTDGTDPDPNNDGDPEEDVPTPIDPDDVPDAVSDVATTDQNTPINIDPLVNDDFGADGPSTGTITIISGPIDGTGVVNNGGTPNDPTDDTFDYTPDPGFSGNDIITYQICDSDGDCDIASVNITVRDAQIGIAKVASTPVDNGDGTFTTTITFNVENFAQVNLGDIQVTDDLSAFGAFVTLANLDTEGEYTVSNLMITANSANPLTANSGFNGAGDTELLDVSAGGTLAVGETVTLSFDLTLIPAQDSYVNVAVASGDVPFNDDPTGNDDDDPDDTTDDSTDGTDPDPNNDGTPEEDTPTPIDPDDTPIANDDTGSTNQNITVNIDPLPNDDFGSDGPSTGPISIVTQPGNGTAVVDNGGTPNDPTDDTIDYTPDNNFVGDDFITYQICDSDGDCDDAEITVTVSPTAVKLSARVRLQGALYLSPDGLMRDDLRTQGQLPVSEPYAGIAGFTHVNNTTNETVANTATVYGNNGPNAIVDWVFVELRSAVDPATVLATRSGLLQRDGDIVDVDGVSALCFEQTLPDMFYVAVRHRNHNGTMTADPIMLTATGTTVDFTDTNLDLWENTAAYDGFEQTIVDNAYALWAGNTNANTSIIYAGQANDKDPIFDEINLAPGNLFGLQTYIFTGYNLGDVDMNANSIYAGQNNDVDPIFNNVDSHPLNGLKLQTFIIVEQLAGN